MTTLDEEYWLEYTPNRQEALVGRELADPAVRRLLFLRWLMDVHILCDCHRSSRGTRFWPPEPYSQD